MELSPSIRVPYCWHRSVFLGRSVFLVAIRILSSVHQRRNHMQQHGQGHDCIRLLLSAFYSTPNNMQSCVNATVLLRNIPPRSTLATAKTRASIMLWTLTGSVVRHARFIFDLDHVHDHVIHCSLFCSVKCICKLLSASLPDQRRVAPSAGFPASNL